MGTGIHFYDFSESQIDSSDKVTDHSDVKSYKSVCLSPKKGVDKSANIAIIDLSLDRLYQPFG